MLLLPLLEELTLTDIAIELYRTVSDLRDITTQAASNMRHNCNTGWTTNTPTYQTKADGTN
jgi:hypothetical protein